MKQNNGKAGKVYAASKLRIKNEIEKLYILIIINTATIKKKDDLIRVFISVKLILGDINKNIWHETKTTQKTKTKTRRRNVNSIIRLLFISTLEPEFLKFLFCLEFGIHVHCGQIFPKEASIYLKQILKTGPQHLSTIRFH